MESNPRQSIAKTALSAERLSQDFAADMPLPRLGIQSLYEAIITAEESAPAAAFAQWRALFGTACGCDLDRPSQRLAKLAAGHGGPAEARAMLFALHTYYALLVKMLAAEAVAALRVLPGPLEKLRRATDSEQLRREMESLEAGDALRDLGLDGCFPPDPFSWYTAAWSPGIEGLIRYLAARLSQHDLATLAQGHGGEDLLRELYQQLVPRPLRHELGEYYTPDWLADHVLDQVGYTGDAQQRLLDPSCGSGTFLLRAIRRIRQRDAVTREASRQCDEHLCRQILENVVGYELSPVAVIAAKANYLIALGELLRTVDCVEIPVFLCDSILHGPPAQHAHAQFDFIVGNPPWVAWDNLPADYRTATKPLWQRYGLFSLSGNEARHGGGKKDLSTLMVYVAADRYLKQGGRMGLVITQTVFQTKGAGEGFRRFRLGPEGDWLRVFRVDDMTAINPFQDAASRTSTIVLEKGEPTQYPVPYIQWLKHGRQCRCDAEPIQPDRAGSPWFLRPEGLTVPIGELIGPSDYTAHLGANSGGANGVYWVQVLGQVDGGVLVQNLADTNRHGVEVLKQVVEPDLLYPLLRWGDVARYRAVPSAAILLVQDVLARSGIDPTVMAANYPRTLAYLRHFEGLLRSRAAYRRYQEGKAFYSMYNVGSYTVAPLKVVWRRMDRQIRAAVVAEAEDPALGRRAVVPQETCVLIAVDTVAEAHYVCAVLNSAMVDFLVASHSVGGGKGFGTPGILDFIKLRRFAPADPRHRELAALSQEAHARAAAAGYLPLPLGEGRGEGAGGNQATGDIQRRIDALAASLWSLNDLAQLRDFRVV